MARIIRIDDCYRCSECEALRGWCNCPADEYEDRKWEPVSTAIVNAGKEVERRNALDTAGESCDN